MTISPDEFLADVANAEPGWSDAYGGPLGVVAHCSDLHEIIRDQASQLAAIRSAALHHLRIETSSTEIARDLGVSKAAVSKAMKHDPWEDSVW